MGLEYLQGLPPAGQAAAIAAGQEAQQPVGPNPLLAALAGQMKPQSDLAGSGDLTGVQGGIGSNAAGGAMVPGGGGGAYALPGHLGIGGTVFGNVDPFGEIKFP